MVVSSGKSVCGGQNNVPFTLSHPFTDQVTTAHAEESAVCFGSHGLCEITLTSTRGTVEKDTFPRLSLAGEQMREFDGQDDCFLESLFSLI